MMGYDYCGVYVVDYVYEDDKGEVHQRPCLYYGKEAGKFRFFKITKTDNGDYSYDIVRWKEIGIKLHCYVNISRYILVDANSIHGKKAQFTPTMMAELNDLISENIDFISERSI